MIYTIDGETYKIDDAGRIFWLIFDNWEELRYFVLHAVERYEDECEYTEFNKAFYLFGSLVSDGEWAELDAGPFTYSLDEGTWVLR